MAKNVLVCRDGEYQLSDHVEIEDKVLAIVRTLECPTYGEIRLVFHQGKLTEANVQHKIR